MRSGSGVAKWVAPANGIPRLTSVSVLVSVHADSPVSSRSAPPQPRGVFWSAAGGEGWNAPPSVFSPDDERDAPYSYSTTPMRSSNMPVTDAPSPARARAAPRPRRRANRVVPSVGRWRCRARRTERALPNFGRLARNAPRHILTAHSPLNVFER